MSYTEVSEQGCLTRMKNAIVGVLIGFVMVIGALYMVFWNEGRAVHRAQALAEGKSAVITVEATSVDSANEGKLVHMTDEATTEQRVSDSSFGVSVQALRLRRVVEMYQWKEKVTSRTKKKTGGGSRTTKSYSYNRVWSKSVIDSSRFKQRSGHENPGSMPYRQYEDDASKVTIGAFTLSSKLLDMIDSWESLPLDEVKRMPSRAAKSGEYIFIGQGSLDSPVVGDVRISLQVVKPTTVSLYAKQRGTTFETYNTSGGQPLLRLQVGSHTAQEMFEAAEFENTLMTWGLRFLGLLLVWIGLMAIVNPFQVMADVIPFIGNIVGAGLAVAAFAIAAPLTLFTIAVGWIVYRPLIGILLMGAGIAIFVLIFQWATKKKAATAGAPAKAAMSTPPPIPGS